MKCPYGINHRTLSKKFPCSCGYQRAYIGRSGTKWALLFLIQEGYSVKKLMDMGFSQSTIYNYRHKWKVTIQPEIKKLKGIN